MCKGKEGGGELDLWWRWGSGGGDRHGCGVRRAVLRQRHEDGELERAGRDGEEAPQGERLRPVIRRQRGESPGNPGSCDRSAVRRRGWRQIGRESCRASVCQYV